MSFQSLNHVLNAFESQEKWRSHRQFRALLRVWPQLVGAAVAQQTQPFSIQRQVLTVAVSSAAWSQNLMFERQRILEKLNTALSLDLIDIRFSTAYWQRHQNFKADLQPGASLWPKQAPPSEPSPAGLEEAEGSDHSVSPQSSSSPTPLDPNEAFQRWADAIQTQSQSLPLCPCCHCPTPTAELKRWDRCSLCAAQQWS